MSVPQVKLEIRSIAKIQLAVFDLKFSVLADEPDELFKLAKALESIGFDTQAKQVATVHATLQGMQAESACPARCDAGHRIHGAFGLDAEPPCWGSRHL